MCVDCCKEPLLSRYTACHESGIYALNWAGCGKCGRRDLPVPVNLSKDTDGVEDEEETISFVHKCSFCEHIVSEHYYRYYISDGQHEYIMECVLCGKGTDSRCVGVFGDVNDTKVIHPSVEMEISDLFNGLASRIQTIVGTDDEDGEEWE